MQKMISALTFIPATDREVWIKVGLAIKAEYGEAGFDAFDSWSQTDSSYSPAAAKSVWKSFHSTSVTIASLFYLARKNGWTDTNPHQQVSPEELRARQEAAEKRKRDEAAKLLKDNKRAAIKALLLWRGSQPVKPDHPYFVRKQVAPVISLREIDVMEAVKILGYHPKSADEKLVGRLIVVPIKAGGSLISCEMIDESGRKTAIAGSAKACGYWAAQPLPEDTPDAVIAVGEGVATMLSAKEATGYTVVAALTHHNLQAVVAFFQTRYTKAKILLLGDLSKKTGMEDPCAMKASRSVNVDAVFPSFDKSHFGLTDFNDMHVTYGLHSVYQSIIKCAGLNQSPTSSRMSPEM